MGLKNRVRVRVSRSYGVGSGRAGEDREAGKCSPDGQQGKYRVVCEGPRMSFMKVSPVSSVIPPSKTTV